MYKPSAVEQRVNLETNLFGRKFPCPVGLAAGFDKDGQVIQEMFDLGFGFVEIGSVTPLPQPGNPKPRMWRLSQDLAILNSYGFNSSGAAVVQSNLSTFRHPPPLETESHDYGNNNSPRSVSTLLSSVRKMARGALHSYFRRDPRTGLVGVNVGRNKGSTTIEATVADYVAGIEQLGPLADFVVINVSSPNTPGLRDMQRPDSLRSLLEACLIARDAVNPDLPLLVKLSPDASDAELEEVGNLCLQLRVDGLVVSNTTTAQTSNLINWHKAQPPHPKPRNPPQSSLEGGLSGVPLKDRSTECIRTLFAATRGKIPIVGVGGIGTGHDVWEKLKAGASVVEVYSMMVYRGPGMVSKVRQELAELMVQNGKRTVDEIVGMDHEELFWQRQEERQALRRRRESRKAVVQEPPRAV